MSRQPDRSLTRALQTAGVALAVFCSSIALGASAVTPVGSATRVGTQPLTVTLTVSPSQQSAALSYWTRARIAAAPALALPIDRSIPSIDPLAVAAEEAMNAGPEGAAGAGAADATAEIVARSAYPVDWAKLDAAAALETAAETSADAPADTLAGTAGVYTYYDVGTIAALRTIYPHRWVGKLTFTTPSGGASCSATAISGNNIVTAAHCIYDTTSNIWYTNHVFVPAYANGAAPFGTFSATACSILTAWVNLTGSYSIATWARHDVAVCTVGRNSAGQTLNGAVGWAGRLWNASNTQLVFNSGYPARIYTDATIANGPAQYLRACTAETFLYTTDTLGSGCFWGRGISGGSWLTQFYKPFVVSGMVNSVNSGLFIGLPNLYGAKFTTNNIVPLCTARGC